MLARLIRSIRRVGKQGLRRLSPRLYARASAVWQARFARPADVFGSYYAENLWRNEQSRSGPGSTLEFTECLRESLPELLTELGVQVFADAPCGDFHWMKEVRLPEGVRYVGVDVVEAMILDNRRRHGGPLREFEVRDIIVDPLPAADMIMCRDCLIHLPNDKALAAVANFKRSGAAWIALSHQPWVEENRDARLGGHRPVNLLKPPFSFPPPFRLLYDGSRALSALNEAGAQRDPKFLAIWRLADL